MFAMPRWKKILHGCANTRRQPQILANRKHFKLGKVLLALVSESREPNPTIVVHSLSSFGVGSPYWSTPAYRRAAAT